MTHEEFGGIVFTAKRMKALGKDIYDNQKPINLHSYQELQNKMQGNKDMLIDKETLKRDYVAPEFSAKTKDIFTTWKQCENIWEDQTNHDRKSLDEMDLVEQLGILKYKIENVVVLGLGSLEDQENIVINTYQHVAVHRIVQQMREHIDERAKTARLNVWFDNPHYTQFDRAFIELKFGDTDTFIGARAYSDFEAVFETKSSRRLIIVFRPVNPYLQIVADLLIEAQNHRKGPPEREYPAAVICPPVEELDKNQTNIYVEDWLNTYTRMEPPLTTGESGYLPKTYLHTCPGAEKV